MRIVFLFAIITFFVICRTDFVKLHQSPKNMYSEMPNFSLFNYFFVGIIYAFSLYWQT